MSVTPASGAPRRAQRSPSGSAPAPPAVAGAAAGAAPPRPPGRQRSAAGGASAPGRRPANAPGRASAAAAAGAGGGAASSASRSLRFLSSICARQRAAQPGSRALALLLALLGQRAPAPHAQPARDSECGRSQVIETAAGLRAEDRGSQNSARLHLVHRGRARASASLARWRAAASSRRCARSASSRTLRSASSRSRSSSSCGSVQVRLG